MTLHPTNSKRTRIYNIFVGAFFVSVAIAMVAAGVIAEGNWTAGKMLAELAPFALPLVIGGVGAVAYYRGKRA